MKTVFFICAFLFYSVLLSAQISGPLNPSSFANADLPGYNQQWVNIENAGSSDGNYATFGNLSNSVGSHTDYLVATNFGFTFLPGTIILGIKVEVECSDPNSRTSDYSVRIVKKGSIGATEKATGTAYTSNDNYMGYGGASDLWGETWDYKSINDKNFGVAVSAQRNTADGIPTAGRINNITIAVLYTFHTLPVQLTSFTATKNNTTKSVKIQWAATNETNMDRYEVERSSDGRSFHSINSVSGRNQNNNNSYLSIDNSPLLGNSFYRLKMIGTAGDEKYSKIVSVEFKSNEFILYPNVLAQGENLYINNANNLPLEINFYDMTGTKIANINTSNNQVALSQLSSQKGIFIYRIYSSAKEEIGTGKIILQ